MLRSIRYHPFGALLPGRNYSSSSYNYGFNGKLKDDEVHGATGTSYDYGFRIYDTRIARFLSLDPLAGSFPFYTPYQFAGNKPIIAIDLDGLEELIVTKAFAKLMRPALDVVESNDLLRYMLITDISHPEKSATQRVIMATHKFSRKGEQAFTVNIGQAASNIRLLQQKSSLTASEKRDYDENMLLITNSGLTLPAVSDAVDDGQEVFMISIAENNFDNTDAVDATFTFAHEVIAHLKQDLRGNGRNQFDEHADFYGWTPEIPGGLEQFNLKFDKWLGGQSPDNSEVLPQSMAGLMLQEIRDTVEGMKNARQSSKCSNKSEKGVAP